MSDLPAYLWIPLVVAVVGIPAWACAVLYRGAVFAGSTRRTAAALAGGSAALLGGWLAADSLLAAAGAYHHDPAAPRPWLGLAFAGVLTGLLAGTRIPAVARALAAPGTAARLVLPHGLRVAGVLFLVLMAQGRLPAVFALPAGLGDIAIGLSAPLVARSLARGGGRRRAVRFHLLGTLDLVVAVGIGFLAGLGPVRPLEVSPSTEVLGQMPLALVATVAVPLAVALHVTALRRLAAGTGTAGTRVAPAVPAAG